jgi:hypothetical protein
MGFLVTTNLLAAPRTGSQFPTITQRFGLPAAAAAEMIGVKVQGEEICDAEQSKSYYCAEHRLAMIWSKGG